MLYFLPVMYVDLVLTNCLVLDGIYALSKAHIDSTPSLKMFPTLRLKQFQSSCSRKIVEQFLFPRLNLPCSWSGDVLDIKPEGGVLSSSTLPIFRDASRLWRVALPVSLSARSFLHSAMSRAVQPQVFSEVGVEHRPMPVWACHSTFTNNFLVTCLPQHP